MDAAAPSDLERRFGGLRRLYGDAAYGRLRASRIAVVGLGGVGSWAVEALARSGVAGLVLIDMDHIAESNINRQVQALGATLGAGKARALAQRIADIHPGCAVREVDAFVEAGNWPALLDEAAGGAVDVVIDACDAMAAKQTLAAWALGQHRALVVCGAAGGKREPQRVDVADLADATHDPLLAALRQRLRRDHGGPRRGPFGLACVFSREAVVRSSAAAEADAQAEGARFDGGLNCHGYGSSVMVTAAFGFAAAAQAVALALEQPATAP